MIKVKSDVPVFEIDDMEVPAGERLWIQVSSHWNEDTKIVLEFGGKKLTVLVCDISAAVTNASRTGKY